MLAYILAIAVGLSSFALYMAAFFFPEIHRKDDFLWSGVGLFYALVLWVCAGRITGGVLLGQTAAVSLVIVFGWQTLKLRRAIAHPEERTDLEGFSLTQWLQTKLFNPLGKKTSTPQPETVAETEEAVASVAQTEEEETLIPSQEAEETPETPLEAETQVAATTVTETLAEEQISTEPEIELAETKAKISPKKGSFFGKLFAPITNLFSKSKPKSPASLTKELDDSEPETKADIFADEFEEEPLESEATTTETVEVVEVKETPETEPTEVSETIIYPEDSNPEKEITPSESEEETVTLEDSETESLMDIQPEEESSETIEETETLDAEETKSPEEGEITANSSEPKPKNDQD